LTVCTNTNNALFFSSVTEITDQTWTELNCNKSIYFNPKYLFSLEKNNPQIDFSYLVLLDKHQKAIAFATIQVLDIPIDILENSIENGFEKLKCFSRKIFFPKKKTLKILVCGNTFVSGEHGIYIQPNQDKKKVVRALAKALQHFANSNEISKKNISAFILKDFIKESLIITDELHKHNYYSFNVEPNMLLEVNENWYTFDDYLASMKTKFRVKARKAMKQSIRLKVIDITSENIEELLPKMTHLYQTVAINSDFNLGEFNLNTYKSFKENLGDNYILQTYWLEHKIVGFLSGIINQKTLDAHFVGIDYKPNRECAIYQRMLYDYIIIGIDKKIERINFGRTASEIKSSVGAIPQDLTVYLRHKKSITNRLLKLFLQKIEPTPFNQKFPFKTEKKEH